MSAQAENGFEAADATTQAITDPSRARAMESPQKKSIPGQGDGCKLPVIAVEGAPANASFRISAG